MHHHANTPHQTKELQPDISFLIADLRWNKGSLKILELGEGPQSFFQGFDELFSTGEMWRLFWNYLKPFNLPVWYVGKKPNTPTKINQFAFNLFLANGGRWAPSLESLAHDDLFKQLANKKTTTTRPLNLGQHLGIIVFSNHGYPNWYAESLKKFKEKYQNFLIINDATTPYVNHKYHTSLLFNNLLSSYRPRWIRCKKKYSPALANKILAHLNSPIVVIKPLNAANGWGNLMVDATELDATLRKILTQSKHLKTYTDPSWSYWANDGHKHFLVEEFVTSHAINIKGKFFDGTMRVVFILKHEQGKIAINFLGCCWKLPRLSLDTTGSIMEKHKSGYGAAHVSQEDKQEVEAVLKSLLPPLYKKMLSKK